MNERRDSLSNRNPLRSSSHAHTVLVADDHVATRQVFALALRRVGHVVTEIGNGDEVLAAVADTKPAAVVLDHFMPGMTGAEIAIELRNSAATHQLPIVIATGDLIPEAAVPNNDPLTRYLAKPVDIHELTSTVDSLIKHAERLTKQDTRRVRRALRVALAEGDGFDQAIEAAKQGRQAGFDYLHGDLFQRLHKYAAVRNHPDPADLAAEVLFKAFTKIDQFDGNEAQFKAWVFRIAHNGLIDAARRRAVRPVETLVDLTPTSAATDSPEAAALDRVGLDDLIGRLDSLTAEQREVVVLRVVADLTVASIAEILDKSPEAVKGLQRRAFSTLAEELSDNRVEQRHPHAGSAAGDPALDDCFEHPVVSGHPGARIDH